MRCRSSTLLTITIGSFILLAFAFTFATSPAASIQAALTPAVGPAPQTMQTEFFAAIPATLNITGTPAADATVCYTGNFAVTTAQDYAQAELRAVATGKDAVAADHFYMAPPAENLAGTSIYINAYAAIEATYPEQGHAVMKVSDAAPASQLV